MPVIVTVAIILMVLALTFYSIGVWSERFAGRLRPWHLALFWLGFACDSGGTEIMRRLAGEWRVEFHTVTGAAALLLMLIHAVWATAVLLRRDEHALKSFNRVSIFVWAVWLVPFVSGALQKHGAGP